MQDYSTFLPLLKKTAFQAGEKILQIYHSEDFNIEKKEDESPITRADIIAHQIIFDNLKTTPFPILSEEGREIPFEERKNWKTLWIVDPIDGTKEFIKKNDEFTVNIALVHQNKPVLGVVYAPALDKMYFGGESIGAFLKRKKESSTKLKRKQNHSGPLRIATSRSHLNKRTQKFLNALPDDYIKLPIGSSLKFMLLAENKVDLYPRFGPCMEWDTAAAHAVLRGMDIEIINMETKKPLVYNKKSLYNPFFIVEA